MSDVEQTDNSAALAALIQRAAMKGLAEAGFKVQAKAMDNIRSNEQIDTGAMLNAVYVETPDENTRAQVVAAALEKHRAAGSEAQAAPAPPPVAEDEVRIAEAMEYGIYQEMGVLRTVTVDGEVFGQAGMGARPYLGPAGEEVRKEVPEIVKRHIDKALKGGPQRIQGA